jgi:hypothetical protein
MNILPLDDPYHSLNSYYANPGSEETPYVQELTQINHSNESDNSYYCQHAGYRGKYLDLKVKVTWSLEITV